MKAKYQKVLRKALGWKKGDKCSFTSEGLTCYGVVEFVSSWWIRWKSEGGKSHVTAWEDLCEDNRSEGDV